MWGKCPPASCNLQHFNSVRHNYRLTCGCITPSCSQSVGRMSINPTAAATAADHDDDVASQFDVFATHPGHPLLSLMGRRSTTKLYSPFILFIIIIIIVVVVIIVMTFLFRVCYTSTYLIPFSQYEKLSYSRGTARSTISVKILSTAPQLYEKSHLKMLSVGE